MDSEPTYSKTLRLDRILANDLRQVGRFLDSPPAISLNELMNRAVAFELKFHPFVGTIGYMSQRNRQNGAQLVFDVSQTNWAGLRDCVTSAWHIDEFALIEQLLKHYLEVLKAKRCLP